MIIWRGYGFLVAVIGIATLALTEKISEHITGDDHFYQHNGWVILIGMLVAAALTYGLHRMLLLEKGRVVIDKETGEEVVLSPDHSLFFVPVQLWPVIFVVIGLVIAVVGPRTSAEPIACYHERDKCGGLGSVTLSNKMRPSSFSYAAPASDLAPNRFQTLSATSSDHF